MISKRSSCKIENKGSNTLIVEEGIAYYEGKEIKLQDEAGVKWVYSSEIKPYQLYSFGQHILFQEGSEGEIRVLSREGQLKMIVPGRKMLDDQLRLPGRLLLTETRADEKLGLFELNENFSVKERGYRMGSVNLRYHQGYLFHKFEGVRCWDYEKETMVWEYSGMRTQAVETGNAYTQFNPKWYQFGQSVDPDFDAIIEAAIK